MNKPLVTAESMACYIPNGRVLQKPICFEILPGELAVVKGPNGVGKTTLIQGMLGLHSNFNGRCVVNVESHTIGYLPQLQNVMSHLPLTLRDILDISGYWNGDTEVIKKIGLLEPRHLDLSWNTASGGERKRTLITRVLLSRPQLLVLDEPFNHLDRTTRITVAKTLERYLVEDNKDSALVMVSHEDGYFQEEVKSRAPIKKIEIGKPDA